MSLRVTLNAMPVVAILAINSWSWTIRIPSCCNATIALVGSVFVATAAIWLLARRKRL